MTHDSKPETRRFQDADLRWARHRNRFLFVLTLIAGAVYIGWLVTAIDWGHPWVGCFYLGAEIVCAVSVFLWGTMLTSKRLHPEAGPPATSRSKYCGPPWKR
jgi:uncharacterized membrane protein (DUF485 family)